MSPKAQWQECLRLIQTRLNQQQFDTWFAPVRFKSFDTDANMLTVSIPSHDYSEYIERNHRILVYQALFHVFGVGTKLTYQVSVIRNEKVLEESLPVDEVGFQPKRRSLPASDLDPQLND